MNRLITIPQLNLSEAINASTSKIFQLTGRSRRSEFWWTMLMVYIISIFLTPIIGFFFDLATIPLKFRRLHDIGKSGWWYGFSIILKIIFLVCLCYDIVVSIADTDCLTGHEGELFIYYMMKYGLWFLIILAYQIVLFVFFCLDSQIGNNLYGESPKYRMEL